MCSEIVSPEASSEARLMRLPELRRSIARATPASARATFRCASTRSVSLLMRSRDILHPCVVPRATPCHPVCPWWSTSARRALEDVDAEPVAGVEGALSAQTGGGAPFGERALVGRRRGRDVG